MSQLALMGGAPVRRRPFTAWPIAGPPEEEALLRVVRSGRWGRLDGQETPAFEREFAAYQNAAFGLAVQGGGTALKLALIAAGIRAGDEVIVPPYTFIATASAVVECNAVPVFADIEADSLCLSPDAAEAAITPRTRALLPVHLGGQPADMDRLTELARRKGVALIEDAAHAHGAEWRGKRVGALGDAGAFSFQASKNLNAGEGGIVVTNDEGFWRRASAAHDNGRDPGSNRYEHAFLGGNVRLTEFQAAILRAQLTRLDEQTERRNAAAAWLHTHLAPIPGILPQPRGLGETRHGYHLYCFGYDAAAWDGIPRSRFLEALRAEGVPVGPGYATLVYEHPVFTEKRFGPFSGADAYQPDVTTHDARCPVAAGVSKRTGCWLPQTLMLGYESDLCDIVDAVAKVYENRETLR